MDDSHRVLIETQFRDLSEFYPDLRLEENQGEWVLKGILDFSACYENTKIQDSFQIEISISAEYSRELPAAKETGGRIPLDPDFHINPDGSFCLGAPVDIKRKFAQEPTLLGFINNLVIPFLFSFSYRERNGAMPYGELSHGGQGLVEYYLKYFDITSELSVLRLIGILATDKYRGHHDCPCGSGKRIRKCHGNKVLELKALQSTREFLSEYLAVLLHLRKTKKALSNELINQQALTLIKKEQRALRAQVSGK
ncbi:MAG TPA: SEC-C domain-containing protein [Smithellaceae bacterium]|jgi:hypothetical protein|nr:SEC-C domain-containing protein [Smithellaceae bacterium]